MVELKDLCQKASSSIAQKDLLGHTGKYPIYGASGLIGYVDFYKREKPYIAIVKDGAGIGRVMSLPAKSSVIGTMQYILPNDGIDVQYLSFAMENMNLAKYFSGATIPHIYFKDYCTERLPKHSEEEQRHISSILSKVTELIFLRKQQLAKLDELVKVRFVEMFGEPMRNTNNFPVMSMTELCVIIDGDRGKNYPKQEEFFESGFCLFLNAKNVTNQGFSFENCMYISKEKDEALRNGKLSRGDVVLTTRGTIGNMAFYDSSVPYENVRINSGMVILRMNRKQVAEIFFIEQFKMQLASIKSRIASGSAQPQLPISMMNKVEMVVPPLSQQNQFSVFVEHVDQQKQVVQQSLDKLELLKKALMQEYFG